MASTLNGPALAATRAALSAAMADNSLSTDADSDAFEPGEIQEISMEAQAEGIRTVFNDPTNFNVKVCFNFFLLLSCSNEYWLNCSVAPSLLTLDFMVRFPND